MSTRTPLACLAVYAVFVACNFPYATDPLPKQPPVSKTQEFYNAAFESAETDYEKVGAQIGNEDVVRRITAFANEFQLEARHVLEVGAGQGYLQDVVADYTGLDISASARKYFHKPFVLASATNMPFKDGEFDALWSVWVVEHIPNPEQAMMEMRRVTKSGGLIFFMPAWNCTWWAPQGYQVRTYSDFGIGGKIVKASIPLFDSALYRLAYRLPVNGLRSLAKKPTKLHFKRIDANYEKFWQADSDASISLDPYEAYLWFTSRGDQCLNCSGWLPMLPTQPVILKVNKS